MLATCSHVAAATVLLKTIQQQDKQQELQIQQIDFTQIEIAYRRCS